jgi:F-type H+-transporting ATPase subunit b
VARARKAHDSELDKAKQEGVKVKEDLLESARRDIEAETRRALDEIRKEVANLTLVATEKVTRKSLTPDDHRQLIEEALGEVDFSALAKDRNGG